MSVSSTTTDAMQPLLHTPESAARLASLGRSTIFELLASGELESVRIGRARRIPHASLVAFVERLRQEQGRVSPAA